MKFRSLALASLAALALAPLGFASDSAGRHPHPYFKDGGTLSWLTSLADAQTAAKADGKLIFIEYGREACGNCKVLCQTTLPDPKVKDRLAGLCVGLAADCDRPEGEVRRLMRENMGGATMLPFVAIVTRDLKWVAGFSGYRAAAAFSTVLDEVEKSPLVAPSPADLTKLADLAARAEDAAAKERWSDVVAAAQSAAAIEGRSPLRSRIADSVEKARDWARREMAAAVETSRTDVAAARESLRKVSTTFSREPEQRDADAGLAALQRLESIDSLPADRRSAERDAAARSFASTRWSALFTK